MVTEFHYRIPWRAAGLRPGHHPGGGRGAGLEFTAHQPLSSGVDPRRLDVRASLRDPRGDWLVRVFRPRLGIPVWVVADISASLGFEGRSRKFDLMTQFVEATAHSALRTGDAFGFLACDQQVRLDAMVPATPARGAGAQALRLLAALGARGRGAGALAAAAQHLGRRRALVFLLSDFHLPMPELARVLDAFEGHGLVPVVLWDAAEWVALPRFGLATLEDPENGRRRTVLLRPGLRRRWQAAFAARRAELERLFAERDLRPLWIEDGFDPDRVTAHFFGAAADGAT
jgi:hypothetical protein